MDEFNAEYFANLKRCEEMGKEIADELAIKAKPCPLCGNGNLHIRVTISGCPPWTRISCGPCGLSCGGMENEEVLRKWNRRSSMSIDETQEMLLDFANSRVANTNYFSELDRRGDIMEFLKEWRKNNDC